MMQVLVVTDPLCSWCWGMASAVEEAAARLEGEVSFGLLLGGINTGTTQPVGDYGRRHLRHIWREVHATTGAPFAFVLPDGIVYNSTRACLAVAAVRRALGRPPFGYLHRLQQQLFVDARDINDPALLAATATDFGVAADVVRDGLADPELQDLLREEFATARGYGTNALPSVLVERDGVRSLLAGGYMDADMLESLIRARLSG